MAPKAAGKAPAKAAKKPVKKAIGVSKPVMKKQKKIRTEVQFHRPYTMRVKGDRKYARGRGRTVTGGVRMDQVCAVHYHHVQCQESCGAVCLRLDGL